MTPTEMQEPAGKITETGFVPSSKHRFRQALRNPAAGIKIRGVYGLFVFLLAVEYENSSAGI
jgi:hypothetical protein